MCFYLRNWQVTFLLYTLGVLISEYIAKAPIEPRDHRVVFIIQKTQRLSTPLRFITKKKHHQKYVAQFQRYLIGGRED